MSFGYFQLMCGERAAGGKLGQALRAAIQLQTRPTREEIGITSAVRGRQQAGGGWG